MRMKLWMLGILLAALLAAGAGRAAATGAQFRPPSVPLVSVDPYFSVWSRADKLTDVATTHWSHTNREPAPQRLMSCIRIDGKLFRIMGDQPADVPTLEQVGYAKVLPTRSIYEFEGQGVHVTLTFMTATLPEDLMVLARPVSYLTWVAKATDGKEHEVQVLYGNGAELVVHETDQEVTWSKESIGELDALKMGSVDQPLLRRDGDRVRIDWGYMYVAAPKGQSEGRAEFGYLSTKRDAKAQPPLPAKDAPEMTVALKAAKVGAEPVERWLMLGYDDVYAAQFFHKNLKAYWKKDGATIEDALQAAAKDYESLKARCARFDEELMADMTRIGGEQYAQICALAHRQSFAASKVIADANGQPLFFCKENTSNGCMGTSDVFYPQAPQILLLSPALSKAMLAPMMQYASSPRWKFPFAPHDVGRWPKANGQVYGGGERTEENQMPVEETGNMLLLLAAVAKMDGNAEFAGQWWPTLLKWAEFLKSKGFDPENQLCTDDFAGHLAHNINLSAKAICGLGAFGMMAEMKGEKALAEEYQKLAKEYAARWVKEAADGDHFKLTFDKPGTWSQKYNLVWDRILGLNLFPAEVAQKEMAYYKKIQNTFGLPLDSRKDYTKLDWTIWTATLTGSQADFEALVGPVYKYLNESESREPMSDWYDTKTGKVVGFISRPVVGGVFIKALYDEALWKKWNAKDTAKVGGWAPLPKPPKMTTVAPTANEQAVTWKYTTQRPGRGWNQPGFDDSKWKEGAAGFGAGDPPNATIRTKWAGPEIWIRREVDLSGATWNDLRLKIYHDEDAQVFINGKPAGQFSGYVTEYEVAPLRRQASETLKPGKLLIAAHCRQTRGGQFLDLGLVDVEEVK